MFIATATDVGDHRPMYEFGDPGGDDLADRSADKQLEASRSSRSRTGDKNTSMSLND